MNRLLASLGSAALIVGLSACGAHEPFRSVGVTTATPVLQQVEAPLSPAVVTTSFTGDVAAPPERSVVRDARVSDCLLTAAEATALTGIDIDTVQTYEQPYSDGTSADYCLYGGRGTALVQIDVFSTVEQSPAELVTANTVHGLDGGAEDFAAVGSARSAPTHLAAGWSAAPDGVNVRVLFATPVHLGSISTLAAGRTPTPRQLSDAVAAAAAALVAAGPAG